MVTLVLEAVAAVTVAVAAGGVRGDLGAGAGFEAGFEAADLAGLVAGLADDRTAADGFGLAVTVGVFAAGWGGVDFLADLPFLLGPSWSGLNLSRPRSLIKLATSVWI